MICISLRKYVVPAIIALSAFLCLRAFPSEPNVCCLDSAIAWCQGRPLDRIEGVWHYPDDHVRVLIRKVEQHDYQYEILAIDSEDLSVIPGEKIGEVRITADPARFVMRLFTSRRNGHPASPRECSASLTACDDGLAIEVPKRSWRFNPLAILPRFWRIVSVRRSDPVKSQPVGMQRIFPSYDGNGSSRFHIRYL